MANLQIRIDDVLKNSASAVAEQLGFDLPTAVRMFLKQMVSDQALPFRPKIDPFYSEENQAYLKKAYTDYQKGEPLVYHDLIRE